MFHVNPETGDVGRCRAQAKQCPFGGVANHFLTADTARAAYEHFMQFAESDESFNRKEIEIDYTPEQAIEKFNSEIKGKEFRLDVTQGDEPGRLLEELYGKNPLNSDPGADLGHTELKTVYSKGQKHIVLGAIAAGPNLAKLRGNYAHEDKLLLKPKSGQWVEKGDFSFKLDFNDKKRQMSILVADKDGKLLEKKGNIAWDYKVIEDKVEMKLQNIAIAVYDRELVDRKESPNASDTVVFTDMKLAGYTKKSIFEKLKSGEAGIEIVITPKSRRIFLSTSLGKVFQKS